MDRVRDHLVRAAFVRFAAAETVAQRAPPGGGETGEGRVNMSGVLLLLISVGICQTPCVNQTMSHPVTSASTCEFIVELIDLSPRAESLMTAPLCACVVSDGRKERLHVGDGLPVFPGRCPL